MYFSKVYESSIGLSFTHKTFKFKLAIFLMSSSSWYRLFDINERVMVFTGNYRWLSSESYIESNSNSAKSSIISKTFSSYPSSWGSFLYSWWYFNISSNLGTRLIFYESSLLKSGYLKVRAWSIIKTFSSAFRGFKALT